MRMGKQGLDKPELDLLILATPIMRKYEQAVGRVLRPYPGKPTPTVVDIVDPYSYFMGMARSRANYYRSEEFDVKADFF